MVREYDNLMRLLADDISSAGKDMKLKTYLSILRTADIISMVVDVAMKQYGINQTMLNILYTLTSYGGRLTPTDLSKKVFRTKQAITLAVDGLEKAGLITREPIGDDRRVRKIRVTLKALHLVKSSLTVRRELINKIISSLTPEETEYVYFTLKKLRDETPLQLDALKKVKAAILHPVSEAELVT